VKPEDFCKNDYQQKKIMNSLLPYEEQIAGKLVQVPLPEMEDTIWSRIEGMLDADSELEENVSEEKNINTKPHSSFLSGRVIVAAAIFIIVLIVVIITIKKPKKEIQNTKPSLPPPATVEIKKQKTIETTLQKLPEQADKKNKTIKPDNKIQTVDSIHTIPPAIGSINTKKPEPDFLFPKPVISLPVKKDSITKKPKGVLGISDSDYRFKLNKNDSIKKN
jgi:hypothetical protein